MITCRECGFRTHLMVIYLSFDETFKQHADSRIYTILEFQFNFFFNCVFIMYFSVTPQYEHELYHDCIV